jgi:hypothetical protein
MSETQALTLGGVSAALVTVGIWAAKQFWNVDVPATLAASMTTIVTAMAVGISSGGRWLYGWLQKS